MMVIKMSDEISFSNMDSWRGSSSGKFGLSFKQIVLTHINRCVINGSCEWHGGYWQEKYRNNQMEKYYIPNSREVYCNSVKMLRALLLGYFDKKMEEADKKLEKDFKEIYAEFKKGDNKPQYFSQKLDWYIELFEQLIMLSKRLNFFEEETSEEEV